MFGFRSTLGRNVALAAIATKDKATSTDSKSGDVGAGTGASGVVAGTYKKSPFEAKKKASFRKQGDFRKKGFRSRK